MKTLGAFFNRLPILLITAMLVISIAIPGQYSAAQGTLITNDDFNSGSLNTSIWTATNPGNASTITVASGALQISVPANEQYTFSNTNTNAPRVLQEISDDDFAVEVKFNSSMNPYQDDKLQGILVYDEGGQQWLRFDFNTDSDSLNTYVGHLAGGSLTHIENVSSISTASDTVPLYMRIQYTKSSNQWMMSYRIGDTGDFVVKKTFTESSAFGSSGFSFTPTHIGLFAGSTGTERPGHTMVADYFINAAPMEPPPDLTEHVYLPFIRR